MWDKDDVVDFQLQGVKFFTIRGRVTDVEDKPLAGCDVCAVMGANKNTSTISANTDEGGNFLLYVNQEVDHLTVLDWNNVDPSSNVAGKMEIPETKVQGPWSEDAVVDIQLPE